MRRKQVAPGCESAVDGQRLVGAGSVDDCRLCMGDDEAGGVVVMLCTGLCTRERVTAGGGVAKVFLGRNQRSALGTLTDPCRQFLDLIEDVTALSHFAANLALCVDHCGVVTAEGLADLRQ